MVGIDPLLCITDENISFLDVHFLYVWFLIVNFVYM